ncbi:MAG TPA: adenylate/guanylate cyclase domain-containing protein, partial [Myxococcota bacterium]|nr:adenylate/guanylate cyclase domain-containing protein [Myxococcota bacterium]
VVRAYDGRVIKSIGDAYMIVFRSPTEAVKCAAAVQDRLHQHNATSSADQAIHIRIAMNIGEVRVHRNDVFGEPVNIAARIESVTPADEIYLSKAVYLTMNRSDVPTEVVGDYELKGLPEPVTVYRVKKFSHLVEGSEEGAEQKTPAGLPFGGSQLKHWRRMLWVRRAYLAMWALALVGMAGAAYLRYRPAADYTTVVDAVKSAVEQNKPMDALSTAGQLPLDAVQERSIVRRYRRDAIMQLLTANNLDPADSEIKALLKEDRRDAEALMLKGMLMSRQNGDPRATMDTFNQALKLQASLAENPDLVAAVVNGYTQSAARTGADQLVDVYLKQRAVPPMLKLVADANQDRTIRHTVALRLEKLGAADTVDWVALAIDDLKSTACNTRKSGIARLVTEGDERAVGPLMKLAGVKGCGAREAKDAAEQILGK